MLNGSVVPSKVLCWLRWFKGFLGGVIMSKPSISLAVIHIALFVLSGCSSGPTEEKVAASAEAQLSAGVTKTTEITLTHTPVPSNTATPVPTNTLIPTATSSPEPTNTPRPTITPTPTVSPLVMEFLQPGQVVRHPPTETNPYSFYTYFPRSAIRKKEIVVGVWPHGNGMPSEDYSVHESRSESTIGWLSDYSEVYQIPLVVMAMPRSHLLYVHVLPLGTFTTGEEMLSRPDLKLVDAVWNQYLPRIRETGLVVGERVFMLGFSSPGFFTHRFAMLHPEKVQAAWLCGDAAAPLPANELDGIALNYPLGVNNLEALTGDAFDFESYREIPHFVCVGEHDDNPMYDPSGTEDFLSWQSQFIRSRFGETNPERTQFFYEYLASVGVPAEIKVYEGLGHELQPEMLQDAFCFLMANSSGVLATPTPLPMPSVNVDGKNEDWIEEEPVMEDQEGDSLAEESMDLISIYLREDENYVFLMAQTADGLTKEQATLELNLDLKSGNTCNHNHELHTNINSDNTLYAWTENPCGRLETFPLCGVRVSWGEVLEVQIPKTSLGEYEFVVPVFANLWTTLNEEWQVVDQMR